MLPAACQVGPGTSIRRGWSIPECARKRETDETGLAGPWVDSRATDRHRRCQTGCVAKHCCQVLWPREKRATAVIYSRPVAHIPRILAPMSTGGAAGRACVDAATFKVGQVRLVKYLVIEFGMKRVRWA